MEYNSGRGFAKSRPAAERPTTERPTARKGPAARRPRGPVQIFHSFLSSGKSTRMHRSASGFEFGYHFNNHLNPFRSFLSSLVVK